MKRVLPKAMPSWAFLGAYSIFVVVSIITGLQPGREVSESLLLFLKEMVVIVPPAFILIGLFEVWVPPRIIEGHLGLWVRGVTVTRGPLLPARRSQTLIAL